MAAAILDLDLSQERAGRVLEDILRLERITFPEHSSPARSLRSELERGNSGLIYSTSGAGAGEEVAGYAAYTCNTSLCATIIELAVRENCRRRGHGEALLRAAVERCRGKRVQRVILHVDPARTAAVALYRKAGFHVDATVEGYYAPGRDAYGLPDVHGPSVIIPEAGAESRAKKKGIAHPRPERTEFACTVPRYRIV